LNCQNGYLFWKNSCCMNSDAAWQMMWFYKAQCTESPDSINFAIAGCIKIGVKMIILSESSQNISHKIILKTCESKLSFLYFSTKISILFFQSKLRLQRKQLEKGEEWNRFLHVFEKFRTARNLIKIIQKNSLEKKWFPFHSSFWSWE